MAVYLPLILIVYSLSLCVKKPLYKKNSFGFSITRSQLCIFFMCIFLICVAGFRYGVGTDFFTYKGLFEYYMNRPVHETIMTQEGFFWSIASFIGMFTTNVVIVYFVYAIIIIVCCVYFIRRYSIDFSLSIFLYIATLDYFSAFNGIRQWTAASIIYASFPLLVDRKFVKYFIIILIAYHFHNSAIFMIPISIFACTKPNTRLNNLMLFGIVGICLFFPGLINAVLSSAVTENYQHYLQLSSSDDGVNVLRVLVLAIPVIISRFYYKYLYKDQNEKKLLDYLINMSTVGFLIMLLATRNTVLARIGMYTSLYNTLLIPYFLRLFSRDSKRIGKIIIIALFFMYMYLLLPVDSNLLPYRSIFGGVFY